MPTVAVTTDPTPNLMQRVARLEADLLLAEEALDSSREDRDLLRHDLDIVTTVLTRVIQQLNDERDAEDS